MKDLTLLFDSMVHHKITIAATVFGMFLGAFGGVLAFYHGWLG